MRVTATIVALAVSASALTACGGGGNARWCEFDSTDEVVADSFCQAGTPGYEWEHGSDSTRHKHQARYGKYTVKNQAKPPVYKAPAPQRSTRRVTVYKAPVKKK